MARCSISLDRIRQPLAGLSALRQALTENTQCDINSSGFTLSKHLWILSRRQSCDGGHLFMAVSRVWTGLLFIFTRNQFANTHICISCKVKLLSTAQSLIFQHSAGRAGGYDNVTHNEAAAAAAASLLTPAGLNAPSLHIKNTTVYAHHLISHLKTRPTILVLKKISEMMQQQKKIIKVFQPADISCVH